MHYNKRNNLMKGIINIKRRPGYKHMVIVEAIFAGGITIKFLSTDIGIKDNEALVSLIRVRLLRGVDCCHNNYFDVFNHAEK